MFDRNTEWLQMLSGSNPGEEKKLWWGNTSGRQDDLFSSLQTQHLAEAFGLNAGGRLVRVQIDLLQIE